MSKTSWKSKTAALLGAMVVASSGVVVPAPAQAYPTCEDIMRRDCRGYWEIQEFLNLEACVRYEVELGCPEPYHGPF